MICEVLAVIVALGYLLLGDSTCRVVSLSAGSGAWSIVRLVIFPFFEPNPLMAVIAIGVLLAFGRPLERVMTGRITMAQLLPTTCAVTGLILLVWCFLFHGGGAEGVPSTQYLGPVPLIMAVLVARCRFDSQSRSSLANDHLVSLAVLAALILDVVNHVAGASLLRCTEAPVGSVFLTADISMWVAWAGIRLSQREDDESFPFVDLLPRELMRLIPPMDRMKKARQTARRSRQFGGSLPSPAFAATNSNAPALPLEESSADDAARRSAIALKALEQVIKRQQQPTSEGTTDV